MSVFSHSLLYIRKRKGLGIFLKPNRFPFLFLDSAQVKLRDLVYRLVAIVKNLVCNFSIYVNALGEGMEGVIVADLTFIPSFVFVCMQSFPWL